MNVLKKIGLAVFIFIVITFPVEILVALFDYPDLRLYRFMPIVRGFALLFSVFWVTRKPKYEQTKRRKLTRQILFTGFALLFIFTSLTQTSVGVNPRVLEEFKQTEAYLQESSEKYSYCYYVDSGLGFDVGNELLRLEFEEGLTIASHNDLKTRIVNKISDDCEDGFLERYEAEYARYEELNEEVAQGERSLIDALSGKRVPEYRYGLIFSEYDPRELKLTSIGSQVVDVENLIKEEIDDGVRN